jgi:hypothetical protein
MKNIHKLLVAAVISLSFAANSLATPSNFATAQWTGRSKMVQTVTYKWVWSCEYNYFGNKFWRLFETGCASSVEVQ